MANWNNYENIEECETCTQFFDETEEEYKSRCRANNPFYF